ncbi:MAG: hypothetical protein HKN16_07785 [Saprospiraceae bacterium]|nr:hypothetical protein [Saprospiraceae bacterium]
MATRLKMTGFARFFIFLLIAAPLIYSGVSIYNGDHPLDAVKKDFGIDLRGGSNSSDDISKEDLNPSKGNDDQTKLIKFLREKNEQLEMENEELKAKLKQLEGGY